MRALALPLLALSLVACEGMIVPSPEAQRFTVKEQYFSVLECANALDPRIEAVDRAAAEAVAASDNYEACEGPAEYCRGSFAIFAAAVASARATAIFEAQKAGEVPAVCKALVPRY